MKGVIKKDAEVNKKHGIRSKGNKKAGPAGNMLSLLLGFSCLLAVFSFPVSPALAGAGPDPNGYVADRPLEEYTHDTVRGGLYYTIGSSYYSGKVYPGNAYMVSHSVSLPDGATVKFARLYAYWTWSAEIITGRYPDLALRFDGVELEPEQEYSDRKGWGIYNYPTGTWAYDVSAYVNGSGVYDTAVENTGPSASYFCMDGVGLLLVYTDPDGREVEYWIGEGADELNSQMDPDGSPLYYASPNETVCEMLGPSLEFPIANATLWTVIQSGNWNDNVLLVNGKEFPGICNGKPYADLDLDVRDVTDCLVPGENSVRFQAVGDYAVPSNSFLVLEVSPKSDEGEEEAGEEALSDGKGALEDSAGSSEASDSAGTPGFGFGFSLAFLLGGKLVFRRRFSGEFSGRRKV